MSKIHFDFVSAFIKQYGSKKLTNLWNTDENEQKFNKLPTEKYETTIQTLVETMRSEDKYKKLCIEETDLLKKCILCRYHLSSQSWSIIMENFIKDKLKLNNKKDETSGDCSKLDKNYEIKVSLGTSSGQINIVQIRPDHKIDYYIIVCYNIHEEVLGKVYTFLIPSNKIYTLIVEYGSYAHGTTSKLGLITDKNIFGRNLEYCLRPNPLKNNIAKKLWNEFLKYEIEFKAENI
jgi:hypothetical protein